MTGLLKEATHSPIPAHVVSQALARGKPGISAHSANQYSSSLKQSLAVLLLPLVPHSVLRANTTQLLG